MTNKTTDYRLRYADRRTLIDFDPNLNDTGNASNWYREAETKIAVWPADTSSTYVVRYLKVPAELKEDADEPVIPTPYQDLIVDGALVRGYKSRDNFEAAQFLRQEWQRGLEQMRKALLKTAYDRDPLLVRTGTYVDYI